MTGSKVPRSALTHRAGRLLALFVLTLATASVFAPSSATAQSNRAILWLFEASPDAEMTAEDVGVLFAELLQSADDIDHIVGLDGLAAHIEDHGYPMPRCLTGTTACEDAVADVSEALRLDAVAIVRSYGAGERLTLQVRGPTGTASRTLEFEAETVREAAFAVVTNFVGATAHLTINTEPAGAEVFIDDRFAGLTPYSSEHAAGIFPVRIVLEGYFDFDRGIELRPSQNRLIDETLQRSNADIVVRSVTDNAVVFIDDVIVGSTNDEITLEPGPHTMRVEAPNMSPDIRELSVVAGEDQSFSINLRESPEARRRRNIGYVYERPFYLSGNFHFSGQRTSFADAEGTISGADYTVLCARGTSSDACDDDGIALNSVSVSATIGYAWRFFELTLLRFSYGAAQIGGSSGDGRPLTLIPIDADAAGRDELAGRLTSVSRLELRPLAAGARHLLNETWSVFAQFGIGWYKEFFEVQGLVGESGDFTRAGWNWLTDIGLRFYLNDTIFLQAAFALGGDFSDPDAGLATGFNVGVGVTWEDVLGLNQIGSGGGDGTVPSTLDEPSDDGGESRW